MVSGPQGPESRRFALAAVVAAGLGLVAVVLLLPEWPAALRSAATSVGLVVAAGVGAVSAVLRLRRIDGPERRAWALLVLAGLVAILGNVWVAVSDADPVTAPSLLSDASIALALAISTAGLLAFPGPRRRGAELVSMFLDGVVAGGALLVIVSVLVYAELFEAASRGDDLVGTFAVLIPALDIALATVALLLILRAPRSQRLTFGLVALGFLLYAVADLTFAVRLARGTFEFGSLLDLGWIVGYLIFGLAAWVPIHRPDHEQERGPGLSDALGTVLVFSVLLVAAVVQVGFGGSANPQGAQAAAWIVLVLATGARQVLLSVDNTRLRRGLERRVAEQTQDLRRLARQNALLLESVGDGIYGVDRDGLLTFMNPSASSSLGHPLDRVAGQRAHEVFHAPPAAAPGPEPVSDPGEDARAQPAAPTPWESSPVARAMREQVVVTSDDEIYRRADGSELPVEITAAPVLDDGQVLGAVVVFRDVTERREVDRMKNEFLSVVSHELRTPLTSIRASLELIGGGHLGEVPTGAGSLITVALESTERLTRLINDLLDIERIESGDRPLQLTRLGVRDLLESAAEQIAGLAAALGIRVEVGRDAGLAGADLAVLGDKDQLLQTLLNLLGNACKFSEPGSTVTLSAEAEGSWVTLAVLDRGRGIPAEKLESVFDRFGQVDASDTRLQGGTGLGLAISRGIVHRHGGQIWAESELGVGTTVSFTVPRSRRSGSAGAPPESPPAEVPSAESPPPSYAAPGVGPTGPDTGRGHGPTVLVCDDDAGLVASFSAVLQTHGFRPVALTDGARVAEVLAAERPDLVLLDLLMPGTTGAQALAVLRGEPAFATTPVVIVSGLGPDADPVVAQDAEGWLVKPVGEQRLIDTVNRTLDLDRGSRPRLVFLVEDDEAMATVVSTRLRLAGLSVVHASSASEAVQRGRDLVPDLVVLDLALPDGTGHDVVHDFRRRGTLARTPLIVYSALEVGAVGRDDLRLGETRFLEKSRTSAEDLIRQVLELVGAVTGATPTRPAGSSTAGTKNQHDGPDGGAAHGGDSDR